MIESRTQKNIIKAWGVFDTLDRVDSNSSHSKRTVLITGGAGYIGSVLVKQLLVQGYRIIVLDRFLFGMGALNFCVHNPNVEIIYSDLQRVRDIEKHLMGVDAIVHLAGLVGDPACALSKDFTERSNILTTRNLYRAAQIANVKQFVFASSCSVYGLSEEIAHEDGPTNPVSIYAETKLTSEQDILNDLSDDCCASILRFSTVFGHSNRPRFDLVVNRFVAQAIETGKILVQGGGQFRPFVHVQDIARAIIKVLEAPSEKVHGQIFNVGDSQMNYSIQGLAEVIQSMLVGQHSVQIILDGKIIDQRSYIVSFDKIKEVLRFSRSISIEAGVQEIVQNFEQGLYFPHRHESYHNVDGIKQFLASYASLVRMSA
jgi:nucleoside-diphosphate-sugar epimerase